jgi:hypothetical protein
MRWVATVILVTCSVGAFAKDRETGELAQSYKGKFLVVMRSGLAVGACQGYRPTPASERVPPTLHVEIDGDKVVYHAQTGITTQAHGCAAIVPEPLHKGEMLCVRGVSTRGASLMLWAVALSPHQIAAERPHERPHMEQGAAEFRFKIPKGAGIFYAQHIVEAWLKPFNSRAEAAQFGNTAGGAFVKQIKVGMSFAEVESVLGAPQVRVDLDSKVLYKYADMTVEFHGGKVVDVR